MSHIDALRLVIARAVTITGGEAAVILAATYPPACQTCGGSGWKPNAAVSVIYGLVTIETPCPDCPTIAQLLAWGIAVATAARAYSFGDDDDFDDAYNECLDELRAVKP